jgi:diaminopimelate epimerase
VETTVIQKLCQRHFGIGADGLVLIESAYDKQTDAQMIYFNSDGKEADFCGNALRCVTDFLGYKSSNAQSFTILSRFGKHRGKSIEPGLVEVSMQVCSNSFYFHQIQIESRLYQIHYVVTGVPHAVVFVDSLSSFSVDKIGRTIRNHSLFQPKGCNVNFVEEQNQGLLIRTYERGIEAETKSCGSGGAAAALCFAKKKHVNSVQTQFASQEKAQYQLHKDLNGWNVTMKGRVTFVFKGEIIL